MSVTSLSKPFDGMSGRKSSNTAKSLRAARGRKTTVKKNNRQALMRPQGSSGLGSIWSIPRQIAFPDTLRTTLIYQLPMQLVLNGASTLNSLKFTSNAYDVDAALGSTSMAGFSELALVYSRFRTLGMRYEFHVCNLEAIGTAFIHGFMTNSISSTALGLNYRENPYIRTTMCGPVTANCTKSLRGSVTCERLFGSAMALYDDTFTGSTTSSTLPSASTMYLYVGSSNTVVQANGWDITGSVFLDVLFIRRNALIS